MSKRAVVALFLFFAALEQFAKPAEAQTTTVIVEMHDDSGAVYVDKARRSGITITAAELETYRQKLRARQDQLLADLSGRGISFQVASIAVPNFSGQVAADVEVRYTLVFNGIALRVSPSSIGAISNVPGVKKVHRDRVMRLHLDRAIDYIRAPQVYGGIKELGPFDDVREGFEGQGIHIAVIDTGFEWSHPMFGGDPTPPRLGVAAAAAAVQTNKKVIYYLPLTETPVDDFGHGTHVGADAAGYLAMAPGGDGVPLTTDDVRVHGVAPQARLMGYKVCSGVGSALANSGVQVIACIGTSIMLALEDAVSPFTLTGFPKPVAHVINLSLGGAGGPDDPTSVAADNAVKAGAIVIASAGNAGPNEATLGSPAAGRHVIAVGANNDPGVAPNRIDILETDRSTIRPGTPTMRADFAPDSNAGRNNIRQPITENYVFAGLADTPNQVPLEVAGRICLVERGSTVTVNSQGSGLFTVKANNCAAKGAIAAVIFNNVPGSIGAVLAPSAIPVFTISREDGLFLRDTLGFEATKISRFPIRVGPEDTALFVAEMAGFSSRGPVEGLGQVKPDITAPGVSILSATSPLGVPVLSMQDASRYVSANGTSFSGPLAAGAAALIKQSHPAWNADMVRTALINTSTNLRDRSGVPKADGTGNDAIVAQGGGLIDVSKAVHVKALMGVQGDGDSKPSLLGSHSFAEVPVVNCRCTHTESVTVQLRDLSGQSGVYSLSVVNNRDLQLPGITVAVSPSSVTVPANGEASFQVRATIDGNVVRSSTPAIQMQWFVIALRSDGAETLRMPFYLKPVDSLPEPGNVTQVTQTYEGSITAGDTNLGLVRGVTYQEISFDVGFGTLRIDASLEFDEIVDGFIHDLDLFLIDPDGNQIAQSINPGGPESLSSPISKAGRYMYRVMGYLNGPVNYVLTSTLFVSSARPPQLSPFQADYVDSQGRAIDFDGNFTIRWTPTGGERGFEIERSTDGENWQLLAAVGGNVTSLAQKDQPAGSYSFRVRALVAGRIGTFVTPPSNVERIVVDPRQRVNITNKVQITVANVSFADGVFQLDARMTNQTQDRTFVPRIEAKVVRIKSASGTVRVINADNGGSGVNKANPAVFDYSRQLGTDEQFSPAETTGARTIKFQDSTGELFSFDVSVSGYERTGTSAATTSATGSPESPQSDSLLDGVTALLQVTVNPLTKSVSVMLIEEIL